MKTIELKLYNIDELKDINIDAYKKAIDNAKNIIIDISFQWAEDDVRELLFYKYGLDNIDNIYYSISYCQGDGACFIAHNILSYNRLTKNEKLNCFEKWIKDNINSEKINDILEYLNCGYNLKITRTSHRYNHKHTCTIDYECFYSSDDPDVLDRINDVIYELCTLLYENVYCVVCDDIEKYLYSLHEVDDDEAYRNIKDNDFYYYDDGSLY